MRERRAMYRVSMGKREERDHFKEPDLDGRIILRWIFWKWDVEAWTRLS